MDATIDSRSGMIGLRRGNHEITPENAVLREVQRYVELNGREPTAVELITEMREHLNMDESTARHVLDTAVRALVQNGLMNREDKTGVDTYEITPKGFERVQKL